MFPKATLFLLAGSLAVTVASASEPRHVSYGVRRVGAVSAHVITVNLNEPSVRVGLSLAKGLPAGDEPFEALMRKGGALAAINGTFFDKETLRPIGDLVVDGRQLHFGRMGTVLTIDPENRAEIRRVPWGRTQDYSRYRVVLGCGPTLLREGAVDVQPQLEGFRDPHVLGRANRSAAGLTPANKLLLVSVRTGVTLAQMAALMRDLGCHEAMNLDGGASMAMSFRGRTVLPAGRRLTNILTVTEAPP